MATTKRKDTKRTKTKNTKTPGRAGAKTRRPGAGAEAKGAAGEVAAARTRGKRTSASASRAQRATESPQSARDPRLPEPGTVLRKVDRRGKVRCECTVEADGIRYSGEVYRSLSAAASAAAVKLGIKGAQNGFIFWGLSKPARAGEDPLTRLQKSWERYEACARTVIATAPAERKPEVIAAIERHRGVEIAAA
jgi:hypothetical protein